MHIHSPPNMLFTIFANNFFLFFLLNIEKCLLQFVIVGETQQSHLLFYFEIDYSITTWCETPHKMSIK